MFDYKNKVFGIGHFSFWQNIHKKLSIKHLTHLVHYLKYLQKLIKTINGWIFTSSSEISSYFHLSMRDSRLSQTFLNQKLSFVTLNHQMKNNMNRFLLFALTITCLTFQTKAQNAVQASGNETRLNLQEAVNIALKNNISVKQSLCFSQKGHFLNQNFV